MGNGSTSESESDDGYHQWCYICQTEKDHSTRHCNELEKMKREYFLQRERYKLLYPRPSLRSIGGIVTFFKSLNQRKCIFRLADTGEKLFYYFYKDSHSVEMIKTCGRGVVVLVYPPPTVKNDYYLVKTISLIYDI